MVISKTPKFMYNTVTTLECIMNDYLCFKFFKNDTGQRSKIYLNVLNIIRFDDLNKFVVIITNKKKLREAKQ